MRARIPWNVMNTKVFTFSFYDYFWFFADIGMTQSRIMCRFRIKCLLLESWVDLNRKIGKHFRSWVDLNQYLGIHLVTSKFWVNSWKAAWVTSGIDSSARHTAWVMNWFESIFQVGTWVKSQKSHTKPAFSRKPKERSYQIDSKVACPKKGRTKLGMNSIINSWIDSNQYSEKFFESLVDLNQNSGSFLCR